MNSSKIMLLEAKIGYAQLFCNALPDLQCNIPVMVIFGHFQFSSSQATIPRPQRVFRQSLSLLRRKEVTDMKSPKAWKMEYMKSTAKEDYDTLAVL